VVLNEHLEDAVGGAACVISSIRLGGIGLERAMNESPSSAGQEHAL
jgi:hypothetical protein